MRAQGHGQGGAGVGAYPKLHESDNTGAAGTSIGLSCPGFQLAHSLHHQPAEIAPCLEREYREGFGGAAPQLRPSLLKHRGLGRMRQVYPWGVSDALVNLVRYRCSLLILSDCRLT